MAYFGAQQSSSELFGKETYRDSFFQRVVAWMKGRLDMQQAENELQHMTDMELADIGVCRGDIHNIVRYGRVSQ